MRIVQLFMAVLLLVAVPTVVGSPFQKIVDKNTKSPVLSWISGQIFLWACFQLFCVPLILFQIDFFFVMVGYSILLVLAVTGAFVWWKRAGKQAEAAAPQRLLGGKNRAGKDWKLYLKENRTSCILWIVFFGLLLFQLVQAVTMTYADGDDAFYVAASAATQDSYTMYRKLPYTGVDTELDIRHGLAPFPVWIAYLAEAVGVRAVTMSHVMIPVVFLTMTYGIFYLLGQRLLPEKSEKLPLFLIFTQLLVLFGDYSFYTAENFMIARSRQGKAALGNIVIPVVLFLLLLLLQKLQEKKQPPVCFYVLLTGAAVTGCLCSTLGALLVCMLIGVTGLCAAALYKQWRLLIPLLLCCVPSGCFALLYLVLG